ncbi:Glycosyl transferase family 2 OS=Lysinibacillus sphaericus OX=1421 GN=LS41612_12195 PE=4 SV=1 [Lysinibacillus sphaericus]
MDTSTNTHQEDVIISIIIPAHNEEKYIGKCLESISKASKLLQNQVEIIVVLNRCTDKTEEIAKSYNCITVNNDDKNLSKIRNTGVERARGEIIVTIDADTQMNEHMLTKVVQNLSSGKYIGGGVTGKFERMSLGIFVSTMLLIGTFTF